MNIAVSNAIQPQPQGRTDASAATGDAADAAVAGSDPTAAAGGDAHDFGTILSGNIEKDRIAAQPGSTVDGRPLDPATGQPGNPLAADAAGAGATGAATAADERARLDLDAVLDGKVDPSTQAGFDSTKGAKATKPGDDAKDDGTDAVSSDVAAQLALAAQWAGLSAHAATTADEAATRDAKAAIDDRRASSGRIAATQAAALASTDVAQASSAVGPAALNAAGVGVDRGARSAATTAVSAIAARTDGQKADDTARLAAPESKTVAIDKLFGLAGAASATSPDTASITSGFVAQISAQVSSAQNTLTAVPGSASAALSEPVGSQAWSQELGQTAIRMATNDLQNASLRLNPEHLGPLDVQMRVDNGVAHMQFAAVHADTRHALESSRATLDQMLGDQGIKLGDWSVGHSPANGSFARGFGADSSSGDGNRSSSGGSDAADGDLPTATVTTPVSRPLGLVDTFA